MDKSVNSDTVASANAKGLSRRHFVEGAVGAGILVALGGALAGSRAAFGNGELLRPPGAQDEEHFLATCLRCDKCRSVCPLNAIGVATIEDGMLNTRTPKMNFRKGYCDFCDKCMEVCPTDSIGNFDRHSEWIGQAVINADECIAFAKLGGCRICVDECPEGAIQLDETQRPVITAHKCNGCGKCELKCPSASYRVRTGSAKRGVNVEWSGDNDRPSKASEGQK